MVSNNLYSIIIADKKGTKELFDNVMKEYLVENEVDANIKNFIYATHEKELIDTSILDNERKRLEKKLNEFKDTLLIFAPTSFGKSFAIRKYINNKNMKSVIITPTISLANEYYFQLRKAGLKPSMSAFVDSNIMILTPEKANTLFEINKDFKTDIVIFDEFYESFSPGRSKSFEECKYNFENIKTKKVYIVPSKKIEMNLGGKKILGDLFETEASLTSRRYFMFHAQKNRTDIYATSELKNSGWLPRGKINKKIKIEELVWNQMKMNRSSLVLTQKSKMPKLSNTISESIEENNNITPMVKIIIDYLEEHSPEISLIKSIKKGVAYHHGSMDKLLRLYIERAFELGEISVLLANTTLTKGVNINPDSLIIDRWTGPVGKQTKIQKMISNIESRNAIGRAGRTVEGNDKLIGNIYIITSSIDSVKVEKTLSLKEDVEIKLEDEEIDHIPKPRKFQDVYSNITSNIKLREIKKQTNLIDNMSDEHIGVIESFLKKRTDEQAIKIGEIFFNMFLLEANKEKENLENIRYAISHWIKNTLMNIGYSNIFKFQTNRIKYISNDNHYVKKPDNPPENLKEYEKGTYLSDLLLSQIISRYENEYGYYFHGLFSLVLNQLVNAGKISKDSWDKYNDEKVEDEKISTQFGWPEPFVKLYLQAGKPKKMKEKFDKQLSENFGIKNINNE